MSNIVGSLAVELRADSATFRSDMGKASQVAASEARKMEAAMRENSKRAKDSLDLLGDTIGVRIPRELKKVIAHSNLVAPALAAAFSGAAIATGIVVLTEFIEKVGDVTDGLFGLTDEVKKLGKEFSSDNWQTFLKTLDTSNLSKAAALRMTLQRQDIESRINELNSSLSANPGFVGPVGAVTGTIKTIQDFRERNRLMAESLQLTKNISEVQKLTTENVKKEADARKQSADEEQRILDAFLKQRAEAEKIFGTFGRSITDTLGLDPKKASEEYAKIGAVIGQLNKELGTGDSAEGRASLKAAIAAPLVSVQQAAPSAISLLERLGLTLDAVRTVGTNVGYDLSASFADAVVQLEGMREVLVGLLQDMARQLLELSTSKLFGGIFNTILGGIFSVGSSAAAASTAGSLGGTFKANLGNIGGVHFADGGRYEAGVPRITGERGIELDIPDHSGYVIPNHVLNGLGGGGDNITQVFHFPPGVNPVMLKTWGETIKKDAAKLAVATVVDRQKRRKIS